MRKRNNRITALTLSALLSMTSIYGISVNANAISDNTVSIKQDITIKDDSIGLYTGIINTSDGYACIGTGLNETKYVEYGVFDKYDLNNNKEWSYKLEANGAVTLTSAIKVSDGYVIIGRSTASDLIENTNKENDAIIIKIDNNGNQEWVSSFGDTNYDNFKDIVETSDGYIVLYAGAMYSTALIKYDKNGNREWVKKDYEDKDITSIEKTSDGYICSGITGVLTENGWVSRGILIKLDNDFNEVWTKIISEDKNDYNNELNQVIKITDGYLCVGRETNNETNSITGIVAKFDENGNVLWKSNSPNDNRTTLVSAIEVDDGYVACGTSVMEDSSINGTVLKYSKNGELECINYLEDDTSTVYTGIIKLDNGGIICSGYNDMITPILVKYNISKLNKIDRLTESDELEITVEADNSLELALSTNQITFANYNGTQDFTNNDLNVTVSSGLNYDLSATMLEEFTPTFDNNAILDSSNLQIKTAGDSNYTPFTTIGDKVFLITNAPNGRDNVHNINFKLIGDSSVKADTYSTSIKFEATQK